MFLVLRNKQDLISVIQVNVDLQITLRRQKLIRIIYKDSVPTSQRTVFLHYSDLPITVI